jgi:aspartate kinase
MSKEIIVNKFGGGILTKDLIPFIKKRLIEQNKNGYQSIAVVSAMPKVTDEILAFLSNLKENNTKDIIESFILNIEEKHNQIIANIGMPSEYQEKAKVELSETLLKLKQNLLKVKSITNKTEDELVSYGEKLSAIIFTHYLNGSNLKAEKLPAEEIPIITDDNFKNANIDYIISEKNINDKIKDIDSIIVIPGFTGITKNKEITTLGRGGTDTTACFVGASLHAEKIILWKDVGGVLSADPKIIKNAKTIPFINYFEAEEAGKIIHDKAIQYVKIHKTPIEISSVANPKLKTKIGEIKKMEKGAKIVSVKKDLNFILITDETKKLNELLTLVCQIFNKYKVDMTLISNTRYSLQIVADNKNGELDNVCAEIKEKVEEIENTKASMIFLVGWFDSKDVSNFNDILVKNNTELLISAFYYENCYRMEAIIKTDDINKIMKVVYKKFIR